MTDDDQMKITNKIYSDAFDEISHYIGGDMISSDEGIQASEIMINIAIRFFASGLIAMYKTIDDNKTDKKIIEMAVDGMSKAFISKSHAMFRKKIEMLKEMESKEAINE